MRLYISQCNFIFLIYNFILTLSLTKLWLFSSHNFNFMFHVTLYQNVYLTMWLFCNYAYLCRTVWIYISTLFLITVILYSMWKFDFKHTLKTHAFFSSHNCYFISCDGNFVTMWLYFLIVTLFIIIVPKLTVIVCVWNVSCTQIHWFVHLFSTWVSMCVCVSQHMRIYTPLKPWFYKNV